jgi:hypothetical protein
VLSNLGDPLDGCLAALTDRATGFGYVLDSVVDRINEGIHLGGVCTGLAELVSTIVLIALTGIAVISSVLAVAFVRRALLANRARTRPRRGSRSDHDCDHQNVAWCSCRCHHRRRRRHRPSWSYSATRMPWTSMFAAGPGREKSAS